MGRRFQILALSGGGYRGLFTARNLELMEEQYGGHVADRFDLIAGTSVGAIMALALACRVPAKDLRELFEKHGGEIFKPRGLTAGWLGAKYDSASLRKLLETDKYLGKRLLGESKTRLLIPAVNYTTGAPQAFKTPHHENFGRDHRLSMVDIAMATSAAPTYFPIYKMNSQQYVDGGLIANAPGLLAVHEARTFLNRDPADIHLLAIGTASSRVTADPTLTLDRGIKRWGRKVFDLTISAQESLSKFMLGHTLSNRYLDMDVVLTEAQAASVGLDKTDKAAIEVLLARGTAVAQEFFGRADFRAFMQHKPEEPAFHHGPNRNVRETGNA
jgi:predicted acylesterase/phospholipase RssA